MKKVVLSVTFLMFGAGIVQAQMLQELQSTQQMQAIRPQSEVESKPEDLSPALKAEKQALKLKYALQLTEVQHRKLVEVLTNSHTKQAEIISQSADPRLRHEQLASLKGETDGQIKSILTLEQATQFEQMFQKRKQAKAMRKKHNQGKRKKERRVMKGQMNLPELDNQ